jgi:hypothetical protein
MEEHIANLEKEIKQFEGQLGGRKHIQPGRQAEADK